MAAWYSDPALYEYLSRDSFWILGIFIAVNGWWTEKQLDRFVEDQDEAIAMLQREIEERAQERAQSQSENEPSHHDPSNEARTSDEESAEDVGGSAQSPPTPEAPTQRKNVFWLQPHLTTRPRLILTLVACIAIILLQLVEGSWVIRTAWRITLAMLKNTYPDIRPRLLGFILYLPLTVIILIAWVAMLGTGVFLVASQVLYFLRLRELRPGRRVTDRVVERDGLLKEEDGAPGHED